MSVTHRVIGGTRHASVSDHKTYARRMVGMHPASSVHPPHTAAARAPRLRRATATAALPQRAAACMQPAPMPPSFTLAAPGLATGAHAAALALRSCLAAGGQWCWARRWRAGGKCMPEHACFAIHGRGCRRVPFAMQVQDPCRLPCAHGSRTCCQAGRPTHLAASS